MTRALALTLTSERIGVTSGWPMLMKFAKPRRAADTLRPILRESTNQPRMPKLVFDHELRPCGEVRFLPRESQKKIGFPGNTLPSREPAEALRQADQGPPGWRKQPN
jgi:hypothetical protein